MQSTFHDPPNQDAIARNLSYLDLGHITREESTAYEQELSAIASNCATFSPAASVACNMS